MTSMYILTVSLLYCILWLNKTIDILKVSKNLTYKTNLETFVLNLENFNNMQINSQLISFQVAAVLKNQQ